jgi:predicted phage terminase large subunit-like protein
MEGKNAWWVAPTYAMALEGWKTVRDLAGKYGMEVKESEKTVYTKSGGFVTVRTADNPDRLRGAGLDFIVLDECAFIKEQTWKEVLRPTLTERKGGCLFISTPKGIQNWFKRLYDEAENNPDWERWQFSSYDNPMIDREELAIAKREIGSFLFSQEYEAQFVEQSGGLIKSEWFKYYTKETLTEFNEEGNYQDYVYMQTLDGAVRLEDLKIYTTVDLATSTKESADYTVVTTIGLDKQNNVYVLDVIRKRIEAPDIVKLLEQVYEKWNPVSIGVESAGFQLALIQIIRRQTTLPIVKLKADKDKLSRALPLSAKMEAGMVFFPNDALWYSDLEKELLVFPSGDHDDQVDSLAYGILQVAKKKTITAY